MSDERNAAQTAFADEGGDERGLVDRRVVIIERLVRVAEALEVECDHPVGACERRNDVAPGEERPAEAMQEDERRSFPGLLDIKGGRSAPGRIESDSVARASASCAPKRGEARNQETSENRPTHTPNHVAD